MCFGVTQFAFSVWCLPDVIAFTCGCICILLFAFSCWCVILFCVHDSSLSIVFLRFTFVLLLAWSLQLSRLLFFSRCALRFLFAELTFFICGLRLFTDSCLRCALNFYLLVFHKHYWCYLAYRITLINYCC